MGRYYDDDLTMSQRIALKQAWDLRCMHEGEARRHEAALRAIEENPDKYTPYYAARLEQKAKLNQQVNRVGVAWVVASLLFVLSMAYLTGVRDGERKRPSCPSMAQSALLR